MIDRRMMLGSGLGYAAALGGEAAMPAAAAQYPKLAVAGTFDCDARTLDAAAEDFGHLVHRRPWLVFRPASAADIAAVIRWADIRRLKVAARGQGHSTYGRAMALGGIVIDMGAMSRVHLIEPDRVVVDAGGTWQEVLVATLPRGLTPPVLTNYLGLSVGGTLAVGGIGGATSRHGLQTDNVLALEVVTGDGRELACSAEHNRDLFDAVRGGLGQCGIVTRATLRLVPAPERVLRVQLFYPDLNSLTAAQRLVLEEGRFDQLQGAILPHNSGWRYQLEGAAYYSSGATPDLETLLGGLSDRRGEAVISDLAYGEDASAFARLEALLRANGQWFTPHPWWLGFLRGSNAERVATEILQELTNEEIGPFGRVAWYPFATQALRTPLVRMPDEDVAFVFNLIRIPSTGDPATIEATIARNRVLYERVRGEDGVLYPVSAFPMTGADWQAHFGPAWPRLCEAKARYDPHNTLTPSYEVF